MLNLQITLFLAGFVMATGVAGQQCNPITCQKKLQEPVALEQYYSSTNGLLGKDPKAELNTIIRDHHHYTYTRVWAALAEDRNPDNVIAIYTQRSIPILRRDCGKGDEDAWNREHIWAKSHGFPKEGQHAHILTFITSGTPNPECTECKQGDNTW
jgi:endonuclease I